MMVVVLVGEGAGELKNWEERKVEVVAVVVAEAVVEVGYVIGSTEKMESTFVLVVQAGKKVVVVDMKILAVVEVDMMQTVVDWEQDFLVEPHNHPVESLNQDSPNSENTDFLLVEAEGQVVEVEEKCDWAARMVAVAVADQNLIEEVVEGTACTTPCPSEFDSTEPELTVPLKP